MTHVHHPIVGILALAFAGAAAGCSNASDSASTGDLQQKVAEPVTQVFDYAPEGAAPKAKEVFDDALLAKGSVSLPYASTFSTALTIANGQTVTFETTNGSANVDTVLVLFKRCDNSTSFDPSPYTERPCVTTFQVSDDWDYPTHGRYSKIVWTNNLGYTQNAHLMGFAYGSSTGTADVTGYGTQSFVGGTLKLQGNAGTAWTSGSVPVGGGTGDPWLFTFNPNGGSDGAYNDDTSSSPVNRESTITGATSLQMWYALSGFNTGTTTVNY
jgi:hypothetical protein